MEQLILGYHILPTLYIILDSLRRKVINREEDDFPFPVIDLDLYSGNPWVVFVDDDDDDDPWIVHNYHHQISSVVKRSIYIFTELGFSGERRFVRTAGNGTWDGATGDVEICEDGVVIGTMKYLDFKLREERDERRENGHWTMYEYKLAGKMLKGLEDLALATRMVLCEITQILDKSLGIHLGWNKSVAENCFESFSKRDFFLKGNDVDDDGGDNEFRTREISCDYDRTNFSDDDRIISSLESVLDKSRELTMGWDTNDRTNTSYDDDEIVSDKSRELTMAWDTNDDEIVLDTSRELTMAWDTNDRTNTSDEIVLDMSQELTVADRTNTSSDENVLDKSPKLIMAQDTTYRTNTSDDESVLDKSQKLTMARDSNEMNWFTKFELEHELMVPTNSNGDEVEANISSPTAVPWLSMSGVDPVTHQIDSTKGVAETVDLREKIRPRYVERAINGPSRILAENVQYSTRIRPRNVAGAEYRPSRFSENREVKTADIRKKTRHRFVARKTDGPSRVSENGAAKNLRVDNNRYPPDVVAKIVQHQKGSRRNSPLAGGFNAVLSNKLNDLGMKRF